MKTLLTGTLLLAITLLTGCFDGSSSSRGDARPDPTVEFSEFVKAQIAATDDTAEAVEINNIDFSFNDQNNEQAFDDLFID